MTSIEAAAPGSPAEMVYAPPPVRARDRLIPMIDQAAIVLWLLQAALNPPGSAPLRYLLAAYFTAGLVLYAPKMMPALARNWPILGLPLMMTISSLWAPSASDAIHKGVMMGLTAIISLYIAIRLSPRQFIYAYFAVEFLGALASIAHPDISPEGAIGIYSQKNWLAMNMFILYASGLTLLLDSKPAIIFRILGAAALPLAMLLIVLSKSATTVALAGAGTAAFFGQA